ncbi:MAG: sigma-70 family RNA polymerase sigma factor [Actinobacteria bacterium]|nr:sigma-70 family RNA polymerase sigma factor [Actinomycetota bacterium]
MDTEPGGTREVVAGQVRRFRAGDGGAAEPLARRALRLSLRTASALMRSRDDAADIAQEVAVDVLGSLRKLRDPEAFDAWVHRITVRHAMRRLKKERRARTIEAPLELLDEEDLPGVIADGDIDSRLAARQALVGALSRLPARQRLALALRYVHDLPDAEIAAALGCRVGTVHALLSRGRRSLREDRQLVEVTLDLTEG